MGNITKEMAISIVVSCAKQYKENLAGKSLLFVCQDKDEKVSCMEFTFDASNFMHLTGLKPMGYIDDNSDETIKRIRAKDFYKKCLNHKLSVRDFEFSPDGTTPLKLEVLPSIINKNLSANMIGDYNSSNPKLYTQKLVGNVNACMGFVEDEHTFRYVPNTVLKIDMRDYVTNSARVLAVFRKMRDTDKYYECTYVAKGVSTKEIKYPSEYAYLSEM